MTDDKKTGQFKTRTSLVFYFLKGSKRYFILAILFAVVMSFISVISPRVISFTVDTLIGNEPSTMPAWMNKIITAAGGTEYLKHHLMAVGLLVIVIALAEGLARYIFRVANAQGAETLVKRMRDTLFHHLLHLPFSWFSENHTGEIIQRCTSDVDQIKSFLSNQLVSLIRIVILITLALLSMFSLHPTLAWCSAAFLPVIILYNFVFHRKIGGAFKNADEEEARLSSIAQENLTGVRVVRAFGREMYERQRFEKQDDLYTKLWFRLLKILSIFWSVGDLFSGLQVLVVVAVGAVFCVRGELTAGNYIAFISYNGMLTWPVRSLGRVISEMSKAGVSIDRLREIMNAEVETDKPEAVEAPMDRDIVFDHVSYQYENGTSEVLDDVSFRIPAGSTFGILGSTGSGKSTLMYLLDRLYPLPSDHGKITIGGVDIADIPMEWIRKNIGMVLQEPYLFSRSLSENIRIAKPQADMNEVRRAARIADLDDTVNHFEKGYDTYVGERGVTLSGGQKQRAAIAQMLIRQPEIMIFDDSLSAVDAETDAKIRAALKENIGKSTTILIAHRITTLMHADHIIVLNNGRIVEEGNHETLLQQNGVYKQIYDLQSNQV